MSAAEAISRAKIFFPRRNSIYAAFLEKEGPGHVVFRGQGGEEIVVAAATVDGGTRVTGSTYLFDQQVARFLGALPVAGGVAGAQVEEMVPVDAG